MKSLFSAHKKDSLPAEPATAVQEIKEKKQTYLDTQKTESAQKQKPLYYISSWG